jgi:hypothetical protein
LNKHRGYCVQTECFGYIPTVLTGYSVYRCYWVYSLWSMSTCIGHKACTALIEYIQRSLVVSCARITEYVQRLLNSITEYI